MKTTKHYSHVLAALLVCVLVGAHLTAYAQQTTATLSGQVLDSSGGTIPTATVRVTSLDTGEERVVQSGDDGRYVVPALKVGRYSITAEAAGFQTVRRGEVTLAVAQEAVINFELPPGNIAEEVIVTDEAPLVETTTASVSTLVDRTFVQELPLNGRNLMNLTLLSPGVTLFTNKSNATTNDIGLQISVAGVGKRSNLFLLDGTAINNGVGLAGGATEAFLGVEAMREFRTLTTSYDAQYGRVTGGIVTIVSRSGTNDFHGSLFEFHRNDNLDARNFFDPEEKPEFKRNQFGGALGGPIVADRTFFFATAEFLRERLGLTQLTVVPDLLARQGIVPGPTGPVTIGVAPSVAPYLELFPLPNGRSLGNGLAEYSFPFQQTGDSNFVQGRVDHRFSQSDSVFGRYTFDDSELVKPLNYPQFSVVFPFRNHFFTFEYTRLVTPSLVNTARFGFARTSTDQFYTDEGIDPSLRFIEGTPQFGRLSIGGMPVFGGVQPNRTLYVRNQFEYSDDLVYTRGAHTLKAGGIFTRFQDNEFVPSFRDGQFVFPNVTTFLLGRPVVFIANAPGSIDDRHMRYNALGLYVQDDVKLRPNLTLSVGLRWDYASPVKDLRNRSAILDTLDPFTATTTVPFEEIADSPYDNPSPTNFAPRIGIAWDPFGDGKTSVRAGFGVFHDLLLGGFATRWAIVNAPFNDNLQIILPPFPRPPLVSGPSVRTVSVPEFDMDQPHVLKWNLGVQREMAWNTAVSVTYIGSRGINLIRTGNVNTPAPRTTPDGRLTFVGPRVNPNFGTIDYVRADGDSHYHGMQFNVQKRFGHGLEFLSAYTWSKAIDNTQGLSSNEETGQVPQVWVPTDNRVDRGLASFHREHVYNLSFTYALPFGEGRDGVDGAILSGWQLNGILTMTSGLPFTPALQVNRSGTGLGFATSFGVDRPDWAPGRSAEDAILGDPEQYFDPTAFVLPPPGVIGNVGRNVLIGPDLRTFDLGARKAFPLRALGESGSLQIRLEAFNLFNRANFGLPDRIVFAGVLPNEQPLPSAGRIRSTATSSRQIQIGARVEF